MMGRELVYCWCGTRAEVDLVPQVVRELAVLRPLFLLKYGWCPQHQQKVLRLTSGLKCDENSSCGVR